MTILLPVRQSVLRLAQTRDQRRKNSSPLPSPALTIKIDSAWAGFIRNKIKLRAAGFRLVYEVRDQGISVRFRQAERRLKSGPKE